MTRKRLLYISLAVLLIGLLLWLLWPDEFLTQERLDQLQPGMTLEEVKHILGEPITSDAYIRAYGPFSPSFVPSWMQLIPINPWNAHIYVIPNQPLPTMSHPLPVWLGKSKIVMLDFAENKMTARYVYTINRTGGGPWNWIKAKYDNWANPKVTTTTPYIPKTAPLQRLPK
jgi:hypothetical protein